MESTARAVEVTKTPFTCELVTIHSKRSFADLISRIESTFQHYDAKTLRDLTADGDSEKLAAYVKKVGEPTEFAIFFWLDQGSRSDWRESQLSPGSICSAMRPSRKACSGTPSGPVLEPLCASVCRKETGRTRASTSIFRPRSSANFPK